MRTWAYKNSNYTPSENSIELFLNHPILIAFLKCFSRGSKQLRYEYIFSVARYLIMKHKQNAVLTPVHQKANSALTTLLNFDTLLLISSPNASFYCVKIGYFFPFKISKKRKKASGFAKALARPQNNFFRLLS